jgi:hypothetical protein
LEKKPGKNGNPKKPAKSRKAKGHLLGVGLDSADGHVRITKGENFSLVGGSQDTHEQMQESAIKFNEQLARRGKRIEQLSPKEFLDIMDKIQR